MNKLIKKLSLDKVGLSEFLIAMFPILLPFLYLQLTVLVILVIISINRTRGRSIIFKPYLLLVAYVLLHEFVLMFTMNDRPDSFLNMFIQTFIYLVSVFYIVPAVRMERLEGSINIVSLICMAGMIYQAVVIFLGGTVTPLVYAFTGGNAYFNNLGLVRPMSFFLEPSNYAAYMVIPLFLAMLKKNYTYVVAIILTVFASTSTTGLVTAFIIPLFYIITEKTTKKTKFAVISVMVALVLTLSYSSIFNKSVDKATNTDVTSNVRLVQGPMIVGAMPSEDYLFGCNYATPYDYYCAGRLGYVDVTIYDENVYMSTIWYMIVKFGVIGLILYIYIYIGAGRKNKLLLPYVLCAIVLMFSGGKSLGGFFVFDMLFILSMAYSYNGNTGNLKRV